MSTINFDPAKPCTTRDGRKARILATDLPGDFPIAAWVESEDEDVPVYRYTAGGFASRKQNEDMDDLINVPEKIRLEYWVNIFRDNGHTWVETVRTKSNAHCPFLIACVKVVIECVEGEGL